MTEWMQKDDAKEMLDDPDVEGSYFAKRVTTKYKPEPWELDGVEGRLEFYQTLDALSNPIREKSREQTITFVLSYRGSAKSRFHLPRSRCRSPTRLTRKFPDLDQ